MKVLKKKTLFVRTMLGLLDHIQYTELVSPSILAGEILAKLRDCARFSPVRTNTACSISSKQGEDSRLRCCFESGYLLLQIHLIDYSRLVALQCQHKLIN